MKTYKFYINNTEVTLGEVLNTEKSFFVIELIDGKYNGHFDNYIPHDARWK